MEGGTSSQPGGLGRNLGNANEDQGHPKAIGTIHCLRGVGVME